MRSTPRAMKRIGACSREGTGAGAAGAAGAKRTSGRSVATPVASFVEIDDDDDEDDDDDDEDDDDDDDDDTTETSRPRI